MKATCKQPLDKEEFKSTKDGKGASFLGEMVFDGVKSFIEVHGDDWGENWFYEVDDFEKHGDDYAYGYHISWLNVVEE